MQIFPEHRLQVFLVALQALAIVGGSLIVTGFMKISDPHEEILDLRPLVVRIVWSWGYSFLLIPAVWAYITIRLERREDMNYRRIWTVLSGIAVLVILACFYAYCATHALWRPFVLGNG
jgi:hypothetical protein